MKKYFTQIGNTIYAEWYGHEDYTISVENDGEESYFIVSDSTGLATDGYNSLEEAKQAILNAWENEDEDEEREPEFERDSIYSLGLTSLF